MATLVMRELRQSWRSFRLPAFYLTLLFLAIMDPLTTRYMGEILERFAQGMTIIVPPPSAEQALATFIGDIVEIGLLVVIAITMGSVAGEKVSGVTAFMVTKPVSRRAYISAKLAVLGGAVAGGIATSVLLAWLYTWSLIGPVPGPRVALAALSIGLYAELIMAATFSASMVLPGTLSAGAAGLGTMVVLGVTGAVLGASGIGPYLPSALMRNASLLLAGTTEAGAASLLLKPGLTAVALGALLLAVGFARFKKLDLQ